MAASTWLLCPPKIPEIEAAQKAGSDYNAQVPNKRRGHDLGSPRIHKAIALFEQQAKDHPDGNDKKFMEAVLELMNHETNGMKNIDELIPFLKVREIKA